MASLSGSTQPGGSDQWITHRALVPSADHPAADFMSLPDRPGVAVFTGHAGEALLVATTASLRGLARRKLADPDSAVKIEPPSRECPGPRTDLRSITAVVLAVATESGFESDLVYLAQARERLPGVYKVVSERWRSWWVAVDPGAAHPEWTKTNLASGPVGVRPRAASRGGRSAGTPASGVLLGPFPDKDAAGRYIERVIDAYDLCRYHHLLVLSPGAAACAYKEMGRCPAPCDGSEALAAYRARVEGAVRALERGVASAAAGALAEMTDAGAAGAFERAAALKRVAERVAKLDTAAFRGARSLERFRWLVVQPYAADRTRARGFGFIGGRLLRLGDVDLAEEAGAASRLAAWARTVAEEMCTLHGSVEETDTLGVVSRWLAKPSSKRRGVFVDCGIEDVEAGGGRAWIKTVRLLRKDKGEDEASREEELAP